MPILCEFNSQTVRSPKQPSIYSATVCFQRRLVAAPRLAHGIRALDVDRNHAIRIKSTITCITNAWVDCHISAWLDTTLYSAIDDIFVLTPADLDILTGEYMRTSDSPSSSMRVDFERRFVTPPKVVVFLNMIDLDNNHDWRLSVRASDIDVTGFTLHIETWGDTHLYNARACWIAYPEDRERIYSTSVSTIDHHVGPVTEPRHENECRNVTFDAVSFGQVPSIFVALNFLDVDCKANLRIKAYVEGVSRTGLVCHIDTWDDTVLYAAGVSIIAFN